MTESFDLFVLPKDLGPRLMGQQELSEDDSRGSSKCETNGGASSLAYVSPALRVSKDSDLVAHGRGLVAAAPIRAGDVLFVHPPAVRADIDQVVRLYRNKAGRGSEAEQPGSSLLESIAETVLLKEMKRSIRSAKKKGSHSTAAGAASFLALNHTHCCSKIGEEEGTPHGGTDYGKDDSQSLMRLLLGKGDVEDAQKVLNECGESIENNDHLLGITRHNAFGPDFHHYFRMERELLDSTNNDTSDPSKLYARILGHYPLAAMINHSCGPTNATRVFWGETMVATATRDLAVGEEIRWPYCPPIAPFPVRSEQLRHGYGFGCKASRSLLEAQVYNDPGGKIPRPPEIPKGLNDPPRSGSSSSNNANEVLLDLSRWTRILKSLDVWYRVAAAKIELPEALWNDERRTTETEEPNTDGENQLRLLLQHGLRLGYTHLYIRYFNQALRQQQSRQDPHASAEVRESVLREAQALHGAFSTVHRACTEHLSLLHLCYELSAITDTNRLRFWTDELKQAHLCRYSAAIAGRDLDTLRAVLKHTRAVLRTRDGWKPSESCSQWRTPFV